MRFNEIKSFKIDELSLDEGNYRFIKADDQNECIAKICNANPEYFKGIMTSIAEDDLGEPLLVLKVKNDNIVVDGNRRLSALKTLYHDKYAPNESIKKLAQQLREKNNLNFNAIQAQVSSDKKLISKTVFERHSSDGKGGTSRIPWSAYAAARFGFIEQIGENKEWRIMALLAATEAKYVKIAPFISSTEFSYEVFRRIIRSALNLNIISNNIFSKRGENIRGNAPKRLINDALKKTFQFLTSMKKKEISLSRKDGIYADKESVDAFVSKFGLSPDNQAIEDSKNKDNSDDPVEDTSNQENDDPNESHSDENEETQNDENDTNNENKIISGINGSEEISRRLKKLKSKKLDNLYYSLCTISLIKHPALTYIGAWSFFEVLSRSMGYLKGDFPSYFYGKSKQYGFDKETTKDFGNALNDISKYGNSAKHSKNATPLNGLQLRNHFEVLEPLIQKSIDDCIRESKK